MSKHRTIPRKSSPDRSHVLSQRKLNLRAMGDAEKALYIAVVTFAVVLTGMLAHGAAFSSEARTASHFWRHAGSPERVGRMIAAHSPVYGRAMWLAARYDSRPYWPMPKLVAGAPTSRATADLAIEYLIPCESGGRAIDHVDTDGKTSRGILQFQDWDEWQRDSGIIGDPDNPDDAIRMAEWGIEHGRIDHWGCAKILKII
jgi:hypothetical protein